MAWDLPAAGQGKEGLSGDREECRCLIGVNIWLRESRRNQRFHQALFEQRVVWKCLSRRERKGLVALVDGIIFRD
jgi:hypothetical protein